MKNKKWLFTLFVISGIISPSIIGNNNSFAEVIQPTEPLVTTDVNSQIIRANEGYKDFETDKEGAKEWAKKEEKNWTLSSKEKSVFKEFINDESDIQTNYKMYSFWPDEQFKDRDPILYEKYQDMKAAIARAKVNEGIISYRNVDPVELGFNKELIVGNQIDTEGYNQLKNQFLEKNIKLDTHLDTQLVAERPTSNKRIILKVLTPGGKGTTFKPNAGAFLDGENLHLLIDQNYSLHVEKMTKVTVKGQVCVELEAKVTPNLDFKNNESAGAAWGEKNYSQWPGELNQDQLRDLNGYLKQDYKEINPYLREGGTDNPELDQKIENISSALQVEKIPENIVLYRWCGLAEFGYIGSLPPLKDFEDQWLDQIREEKAYMSTSVYSGNAQFQARNIILRLNVPKGTAGEYLSVSGFDGFASERELLLDKGQKYHIDRISKVNLKGRIRYLVDASIVK